MNYGVDPAGLREHAERVRDEVVARVRAAADLARGVPGETGTAAALRGLAVMGDELAGLVHATAAAYAGTEQTATRAMDGER
ncbi:hypothetical protein Afil01_15890 [Actinorhabdospora filicis]|uniref:Uncharacterized protein n=1 Tax=Actinorhabdospora filicis TaxID=1785913 RepID=A0A9W6SIW3_9ACTN|nr:hypothetical protein [Actinorhabdospora filicis]GLZ76782.1 hypothetical protein Afil01_15890 [Actinorhabdospora filicis]